MNVRVSGKQVDIGEALPELVRSRLQNVIVKHFKGGSEAVVVFSHEGSGYHADCKLHLDAGVVLAAEGIEMDIHRALDAAIEHLEKQIRRYKRRLKNHHDRTRAPKGSLL
jgi:ribosomal subunit interface protein